MAYVFSLRNPTLLTKIVSPTSIQVKVNNYTFHLADFNIDFLWVPAPTGILDNASADHLAKSTGSSILPSNCTLPWSDISSIILRRHLLIFTVSGYFITANYPPNLILNLNIYHNAK